ncbi:hypothetical protein HF086_009073 [Spodoptera exigua]|uniref:Uncharacterized protein n=1 Tax=Spodoptera exigua TaxID=7107 RepID=A0A922SAR6_SPOEX|nr:hypothetical protein HF086_009073 [Spodoptera exigua]
MLHSAKDDAGIPKDKPLNALNNNTPTFKKHQLFYSSNNSRPIAFNDFNLCFDYRDLRCQGASRKAVIQNLLPV